jgi:hypothetical protein
MIPGYKWLKWVPNGVIKSAIAADWHLQTYLLGKPPVAMDNTPTKRSESPRLDGGATPTSASKLVRRASQVFGTRFESPSKPDTLSSSTSSLAPGSATQMGRSPRMRNLKIVGALRSQSDNSLSPIPIHTALNTPSTSSASMHLLTPNHPEADEPLDFGPGEGFSLTAQTLSTLPAHPSLSKPPLGPSLTHALTQSSHAESEPGTTSDLLRIVLNRPNRPWGYSYADLTGKVAMEVWWGEEDDKVGERGMRWLESVGARLRVVKGEGHNLMTCSEVLLEVFASLRKDAGSVGLQEG